MVTIRIKENSKQAKMFVEYAKTLPYVDFVEKTAGLAKSTVTKTGLTPKQQSWVNDLKKSMQEAKEVASGKQKGQTLKSFLDEL